MKWYTGNLIAASTCILAAFVNVYASFATDSYFNLVVATVCTIVAGMNILRYIENKRLNR